MHANDAPPTVLPTGWEAAVEYPRLNRVNPSSARTSKVREAAVAAVLQHAARCVRHAARPTEIKSYPWPEAQLGELDLEATLEAGFLAEPKRPENLRVRLREDRRSDIVLILDMSLSMTGEKIALLAVAAAVFALKLHCEDLAFVAFDSTPITLKRLGETVSPREIARRVLEVPARGYTNIEGGMRRALTELRASRRRQKAAVLMSDGVYNVGWDPTPAAKSFQRLHVIHLDEGDRDRGLCRRLAAAGRGRYYRAEQFEGLPWITYSLVQDLFR